jgi:hypothetical protein
MVEVNVQRTLHPSHCLGNARQPDQGQQAADANLIRRDTRPAGCRSKFNPQHELELPWQPGAGVRTLTVHRRRDHTEASGGLGNKWTKGVAHGVHVLRIGETELSEITKLHMVKNVERLYSKLKSEALGQFCFLHQRQVHLPDI